MKANKYYLNFCALSVLWGLALYNISLSSSNLNDISFPFFNIIMGTLFGQKFAFFDGLHKFKTHR